MKYLKPMTVAERQEEHRKRLESEGAKRFSVTLSAESLAALDGICEATGQTKRAAIEAALVAYCKTVNPV